MEPAGYWDPAGYELARKSGRGDKVGFFGSIESLNNFKTFVSTDFWDSL